MVFLDLLNRVDYEFSGLNFLRKIKVSIINWENNCIYNYISKKGHNCEIYDSSKTVSRHQYPYLKRIRYANISKSTVSNSLLQVCLQPICNKYVCRFEVCIS